MKKIEYIEDKQIYCDGCDHYAERTFYEQDMCDPCFWSDPEVNSDDLGCKECVKGKLCDEHFALVYPHRERCSVCKVDVVGQPVVLCKDKCNACYHGRKRCDRCHIQKATNRQWCADCVEEYQGKV